MPTKYRLKDNHPTMQKLDKICELANQLGISIEFAMPGGIPYVTDHSLKQSFELLDVDQGDFGMPRSFTCFPMMTEYKLVYEKP